MYGSATTSCTDLGPMEVLSCSRLAIKLILLAMPALLAALFAFAASTGVPCTHELSLSSTAAGYYCQRFFHKHEGLPCKPVQPVQRCFVTKKIQANASRLAVIMSS